MLDLSTASSVTEIVSAGDPPSLTFGGAAWTVFLICLGAALALLQPFLMSRHDRRERRTERAMQLRKETFMGAIEAATGAQRR